jgi:predicted nucleic acid-binding protein
LQCITDSSIWIDLHVGGLIEKVFQLPFQLTAPDLTLEELQEPENSSLERKGLRKRSLTGRQIQQIVEIAARYPAASREDLSALVLAKEEKWILLTSDGSLRRAAKREGVAVHGTLWLLDRLIHYHILTRSEAVRALKRMKVSPRCRLPHREAEERLRRWDTRSGG